MGALKRSGPLAQQGKFAEASALMQDGIADMDRERSPPGDLNGWSCAAQKSEHRSRRRDQAIWETVYE
jgi:hypothetical protein